MAPLTKSVLKFGVVVGTVPAACIALGYRMRAVQASENSTQEGPRIYKACDLPIYNTSSNETDMGSEPAYPRNAVEEQIGNVRRAVQGFFVKYKETYDVAKEKVDIGVEHSKSTLDFVQNNPGELPRVAFITVGSLGGFILGYRGSIVRRLLYGSVAGLSCAALCYPQMTVGLSQQAAGAVTEKWEDFRVDELTKGNWPFVKDESTDEENRRKLGLPKNLANVAGSPGTSVKSQIAPAKLQGDHGQSNPEDKDLYSTRSS
ncbi:MICOS complex subunit [Elysia marginata]|uniref:MICOS complex subunit n=1 Tax=Elysia marginata TaxID=1093978 RepID=A0AAV4EL71_9GAST|nr:MICOS complex subunit [Elysia marginata]